MKLAILYAFIATVATVANIFSQDLAYRAYGGTPGLYLSVALGTAVGLILKYILDKRFIFGFRAASSAQDARIFVVYTLMGIGTTALFWGVELAFWFMFRTDAMRYLGGVIGLGIGYWAKYHLDKRFVFRAQGG